MQDFASPVALLTDHEEMVIALVHPLVQVYTIPRTGQLAYVGHICNFRQTVAKFLQSLPIPKKDFPFVMVRPRTLRNRPSGKAPFKVDVHKLRAAFHWLKQNNPYYYNVEWIESREQEWNDEEIPVGTTREEDITEGLGQQVTGDVIRLWLRESELNRASGEAGFPIGNRLLNLLKENVEPGSASSATPRHPGQPTETLELPDFDTDKTDVDPWNSLRAKIATTMRSNSLRAANAVPDQIIAVFLHFSNLLDLGACPSSDPNDMVAYVRGMPESDWTQDITLLHSELHIIRIMLCEDEPIQSVSAVSTIESTEDVGLRSSVLEHMATTVNEKFGQQDNSAKENVEGPEKEGPGSASSISGQPRQPKFPRVDPPEVEDDPGQGIAENTPGYIPQAFPSLFPHGLGDFHASRGNIPKLLRFEEWGRFVMLYHDGRFARHTRFRYWLLDTELRLMTPGMQRTFFKTREVASKYTLHDLEDKNIRKNLVQQMSTATNQLPGSVGERRKMRQHLEAMVHQIEAETADLGLNGGAGIIPAGFCTLTCPVYKWSQLHHTVLKSYPSGDPLDPKCREHYLHWEALPPGPARELMMKKEFYKLSVTNPAAVAWYCSLKLEVAVHLVQRLLTDIMQSESIPGLAAVKEKLKAELCKNIGEDVEIDELLDLLFLGSMEDFWATFEWSPGGMLHAHIAFWMVGAPRLDKIIVPKEKGDNVIEVRLAHEEDSEPKPTQEAANLLASFWDRIHTEFNVAKAVKSSTSESQEYEDTFALCEDTGVRHKLGRKHERESPSPESISYETLMYCLLGNTASTPEEETKCWQELDEILNKCGRCGDSSTWPGSASQAEKHAIARKFFVAALSEWTNMHDLHRPFALGRPAKDQPCAAVEHEHSSRETVSCNKLFPRKRIDPGAEEIAEDPRRRGLFRIWLTRN